MRSISLVGTPTEDARAATHVPASELRVDQVYEAHVDFVWRSARSLGVREINIDDVVQEVFVVVQRRLAEFEGRSDIKTWLFGITRRVVRAHVRQQIRSRTQTETSADLADPNAACAESQLASLEGARLLYALLDELDADLREVFVLSELEEMSGPAIAEALDLELSNVYARVRRARLAFDAALKRHRARQARTA
ncbi:MAG TPA: sigma-70 family RNA polymerase sigma factor [Polyangiales bacterium]|nr:sigma-70 family RNA polymerase sigma factor [Polyangiales bacterium]